MVFKMKIIALSVDGVINLSYKEPVFLLVQPSRIKIGITIENSNNPRSQSIIIIILIGKGRVSPITPNMKKKYLYEATQAEPSKILMPSERSIVVAENKFPNAIPRTPRVITDSSISTEIKKIIVSKVDPPKKLKTNDGTRITPVSRIIPKKLFLYSLKLSLNRDEKL